MAPAVVELTAINNSKRHYIYRTVHSLACPQSSRALNFIFHSDLLASRNNYTHLIPRKRPPEKLRLTRPMLKVVQYQWDFSSSARSITSMTMC